jgi:3D (Asp-Asp-Asp) domain-containing protein
LPSAAWSSTPSSELASSAKTAFVGDKSEQALVSLNVTVTAYCACPICCGKSDGITSSGALAKEKHTIAVDPNVIPMGSQVHLEGLGTFIAEDTGGAIKGNRIDVYMEDHNQALQFGILETKARLFKII